MSFNDLIEYLVSAPIREVFKIAFLITFVFEGVRLIVRFIYNDPNKTLTDLLYDLLKGDEDDNGI